MMVCVDVISNSKTTLLLSRIMKRIDAMSCLAILEGFDIFSAAPNLGADVENNVHFLIR